MDINAYLERIGVPATSPAPSLAALRQLHRQHVLSVPFESLSIHSGEKILLDPALLYEKIVERRRGGFCCENNGLFLWVLRVLGYKPRILSARVQNKTTGAYGPPYDHMVLTVELEGRRWLCDVGFGEGIRTPFPLESGWEEEQDGCRLRLRVEKDEWFLEKKEGDGWRSLYKFTLQERRFEEFQGMCDYHQTSPSSLFFCKSLCSLQLPRGRVTYLGRRLITTHIQADGSAVKTTRELTDEEIPAVLRDTFGVVLSGKLVPKDDDILPPPLSA
ncbi:arylamine N-acetyltransferase 2-like [Spea bombifrons]|uniref:arylamine N-acetyltransferase 2-like n=1 Tax=Spea bombifrons TaxID=233779 RepID=UPI002349CF2C|nr:arylamine N-acetyltransferase 2-like [Spea bombifrons]XP_053326854.1 arylamine N-acetyltransferase 2-like [Spea bombifrons]